MPPDLRDFAGVKPKRKPRRPHFSSGPTVKHPGWLPDFLKTAPLGRWHRSEVGAARVCRVVDLMRQILAIPDDYRIGIVPGSDTGAMEMSLWSMLGARGVDVLAWEVFGKLWLNDIVGQLKLDDVRVFDAEFGALPDLSQVDDDRDVVFTWNGTTSGVCVPHGDWINPSRPGLMIADATSAIFALPVPCHLLDVITFSWQKALGSEAAHGVIILSPKAVERLETYTPPWPMPKVFRLTKDNTLIEEIFNGAPINTPSMMCVEDAIDALEWVQKIGGLDALYGRVHRNRKIVDDWISQHSSLAYLAKSPPTISSTSLCLNITADWFVDLDETASRVITGAITAMLEAEGVAFDINAHRLAPPGLRIWGGPTVEADDIEALLPWIDWALEAGRGFKE